MAINRQTFVKLTSAEEKLAAITAHTLKFDSTEDMTEFLAKDIVGMVVDPEGNHIFFDNQNVFAAPKNKKAHAA